jgi:hypothetical protein
MEAPPGTADSAFKVRDSVYFKDSAWMEESFHETCALAEVLVPGVRLPTFDAAAKPEKTHDALCGFRSSVVDLAWNQPGTRELIEDISGRRFTGDIKALNCQQVRDLFVAVGVAKARDNDSNKRPSMMPQGDPLTPTSPITLGQLNEVHKQFWSGSKTH